MISNAATEEQKVPGEQQEVRQENLVISAAEGSAGKEEQVQETNGQLKKGNICITYIQPLKGFSSLQCIVINRLFSLKNRRKL